MVSNKIIVMVVLLAVVLFAVTFFIMNGSIENESLNQGGEIFPDTVNQGNIGLVINSNGGNGNNG